MTINDSAPTRFDNIRSTLLVGDGSEIETWAHEQRVRESLRELEEIEQKIKAALSELGVPGEGYPAPVANAVELLQEIFE